MADKNIFHADGDDPKMIEAFKRAQTTFRYFWRELYWEYRRIVPALDMACVKVAFTQEQEDGEELLVEHMWINEIDFNGDTVKGTLINDPGELTNVKNGEAVEFPLDQISDWLFVADSKTYGGFTIQAMRSDMNLDERKEHDKAWGLNFGDFNDILLVNGQKKNPENLVEHPMSMNMKEKFLDFIKTYPGELTSKDELGYTILHKEAIAGNRTIIEVLLQSGVDIANKTNSGKTALDFARQLNWEHIIPLLER